MGFMLYVLVGLQNIHFAGKTNRKNGEQTSNRSENQSIESKAATNLIHFTTTMLHKSNSSTSSTISSSTQSNISKCTTTNSNSGDEQLKLWPPSAAVVDGLVLKLKAKHGDMEANWEKIILRFKKELHEEKRLKPSSSSGGGGGRAKFCVPLSRREMEDFEDMGERRLRRKPKKRPKIVQNRLDTLFPGLWLTEIHADLYRVSETKKR